MRCKELINDDKGGGCLSASFFVFNNLRAVLLGFGDFLYFCGWRWLGCCIRLTSGSWLRSWAALRGWGGCFMAAIRAFLGGL